MPYKILTIVAFSISLLAATEAAAADFHPTRVRLIVHGDKELDDKVSLSGRFVLSPNLRAGIAPLAFAGVKIKPVKVLTLSPYLGYSSIEDEPFVSFGTNLNFKHFVLNGQTDYRFPSHQSYNFAFAEWKATKWLLAGLEYEAWGNYTVNDSWTHGAGPNVMFRLDGFGIDLALHGRQIQKDFKPEVFIRCHLSF